MPSIREKTLANNPPDAPFTLRDAYLRIQSLTRVQRQALGCLAQRHLPLPHGHTIRFLVRVGLVVEENVTPRRRGVVRSTGYVVPPVVHRAWQQWVSNRGMGGV